MNTRMLGIVVFLVIVLAVVISQTLFTVDETEQAIILQFGNPVATVQQPGLKIKSPFIQNVIFFEKRILSSDALPQEYLTADKKRLVVDHVTRWKITDPLIFFKAVTTEAGARARLDDIVFSELRQELAHVNFVDVISTERESIMEAVARSANEKAEEYGIKVVDVRTKRADLPEEVEQSVFNRMIAERKRESNLFRAEGNEQANIIRAQADRDSTVIRAQGYEEAQRIRGEGEAEAIQIYAEALGQDPEFYAFSRRIQAYGSMLKDGDKVVIPANSDFFRFLTNNGLRR